MPAYNSMPVLVVYLPYLSHGWTPRAVAWSCVAPRRPDMPLCLTLTRGALKRGWSLCPLLCCVLLGVRSLQDGGGMNGLGALHAAARDGDARLVRERRLACCMVALACAMICWLACREGFVGVVPALVCQVEHKAGRPTLRTVLLNIGPWSLEAADSSSEVK